MLTPKEKKKENEIKNKNDEKRTNIQYSESRKPKDSTSKRLIQLINPLQY